MGRVEPEGASRGPVSLTHGTLTPRRFYIPVWVKFALATGLASAWFGVSLGIARPWVADLGGVVGEVPAWLIVLFVALIPGFLNAHLAISILLDRPPPLRLDVPYPPVTVIIAAYNEEGSLEETLLSLAGQDYPSRVDIIVVDDGSHDETLGTLARLAGKYPNLTVIPAPHGGKAFALNYGLAAAATDLVVTIDADTFLHHQALRRIVARMVTDPPNTAAVAGAVLVRNSRDNLLTRLQEWDYFLAIASVKRQQSLYQGTLVAQGAFSIFKKAALFEITGWSPVVGEDIFATWALQKRGYRIGFEATACAFTRVPATWRGFNRQRQRWARGMIESLKAHLDLVWKRPRLSAFFVVVDLLFPLLDGTYSLVFIPGIVLALFGYYWIAGLMTLLVIPLIALVALAMYWKQVKVFDELGLRIRRNRVGFVAWLLCYQFLMSPVATLGYAREILGTTKRW
ncbi:MAG: glycosyltransferase family 2 protein [Armatimonadota bacterium]|nr:glycosyltransferase family 2 protein [Armatimonadota bacterium]